MPRPSLKHRQAWSQPGSVELTKRIRMLAFGSRISGRMAGLRQSRLRMALSLRPNDIRAGILSCSSRRMVRYSSSTRWGRTRTPGGECSSNRRMADAPGPNQSAFQRAYLAQSKINRSSLATALSFARAAPKRAAGVFISRGRRISVLHGKRQIR